MKKKDDRKVKMKYKGQIPRKIAGIGRVEPGSTFDAPGSIAANLARDPLFEIVTEGKEKDKKYETRKGKKDSNKNPAEMPKEEKEVKDEDR